MSDNLFSQLSQPNTVTAFRTDTAPTLDGVLDEPCWNEARHITNFHQRELTEGAPITERTECAIVYTRRALYIGVWCYDSQPELITNKFMHRDFNYWLDGNFEIIFDTFLSKRNGYVFVINPNGARSDVQIRDEGKGFNREWNGIWDAETQITEEGWFGEIEIPFSTLKYPDKKEHVWGVNFERNIRRKQEQAFWQGWSRDYDFEHVSHAGTLLGLRDIEGDKTVEIKPYISSGIAKSKGEKTDIKLKIGGDVDYLITPTLKLNLTANTDFAQVESDMAQINLTRFNISYPEQRQFFLEGQNLFSFDIGGGARTFYSRSIGINEDSEEVPILGGLRLTGNAGDMQVGLMSIQTARKGELASANNSVLRLRYNVLEQSNVGIILTTLNSKSVNNYVCGADFNYMTAKFLGDKKLNIDLAVVGSAEGGQTTGHRNMAYDLYVKYPNDVIWSTFRMSSVQRDFEPGLGFLTRKSYDFLDLQLDYRPRPESIDWLTKFDFKLIGAKAYFDNNTGQLQSMRLSCYPFGFQTSGGHSFYSFYARDFERLTEEFNIFSDIMIAEGKYWYNRYAFGANTYQGNNFYIQGEWYFGEYMNGKRNRLWTAVTWNLNPNINISADYTRNYFDISGSSFITDNIGGRVQYAFNPKLYSSLFGQWNNDRDQIILNARLNWIPVIGSDFYLAVNQYISTTGGKYILTDTVLLAKFIWRFAV